jgi:hypothetical protein
MKGMYKSYKLVSEPKRSLPVERNELIPNPFSTVRFVSLLPWLQISSSLSSVSSGKSPTVIWVGLTNPPYFGQHSKYLLPSTLAEEGEKLNYIIRNKTMT